MISWGIIGCGDVTEKKSGPAFNKVAQSRLVAVMRRNEEKVKDYARRHAVPNWYTDANELINDPAVNAIYIATPPSSHEQFTLAAIAAGKPVYVEKPMATDAQAAGRMYSLAQKANVKLVVAHYRRAQPFFQKIQALLAQKAIGNTRFARIKLYKSALTQDDLLDPKTAWRVDPAIAGGGLFHDLSPHQLDILYHFFGKIRTVSGIAVNQAKIYNAPDTIACNLLFESGIVVNGLWDFGIAAGLEEDSCEIFGDEGCIQFSFFNGRAVTLKRRGREEVFPFEPLEHVQQPMIEQVVNYFLGEGPNPCSGADGVQVMQLIDRITAGV